MMRILTMNSVKNGKTIKSQMLSKNLSRSIFSYGDNDFSFFHLLFKIAFLKKVISFSLLIDF
jgi:hypothetical protein